MDLFKEEKPIEKLLRRFETKLQSANVLLKDAEEKQLADEDVRKWLHNLKEVIFRADELTDKIDYEVLRRKLEGASISSTFSAKFGKSVEDEIEDILADLESLLNQNAVLGIVKLLQRFETKLQSANVLLKDAEEKQLTDEDVRKWLHNLKEVLFRADKLKDKIDYEVLKRKLEGASIISTFSAKFDKSLEDEIEDILADLESLLNQNAVLGMKAVSLRLPCAPLVIESTVYGREADKEAILKLVQSDTKHMVVPIVGMGGIGKTTLSRLVFYDDSLDFHTKVWVTVSTESDVFSITKRIFEGVTSIESSSKELHQLQRELEKALKGKKFLFVLDDVWNEYYTFWDELRRPFTSGASGSKIIITTRSTIVASIVNDNCEELYNLGGLSDSICWEFFIRHAIKNEDLNAHPDLRDIGKEIVRKCEGLPVAVKSVAALLHSLSSLDEWRTILENKIWDWKLQETTSKNILPALWLSYSYLSPELKRCFAYCSIFPKDYEFLKGELILLWMGEGLLQSKGEATVEDVGEEYFKILTSRSFFQPVKSKSSFIMHGCLHDLATFVLGDFGFRLEKNNLQKLPEEARHLSIMKKDIRNLEQFEGLFKAKFLRTFLTLEFNRSSELTVPLQELLRKEKWLRVVSLSHYLSITELPSSVGNLKHLRYLDLSHTAIREIPSTVCSLYNLETLLLKCCRNLTRLPAEIGRLLKIRHIDFDNSPVKELPLKICNLKDLQTLTGFIVCEEDGGSRINELGDLQHLRGKFNIWGLENVVDIEKVSEAKLRDKRFLTRLGLYWYGDSAGSSDPVKHRQVLDRLQPHRNLKELHISGYNGTSFSDWMGDQSFRNIVKVELFKCGNCDSLSPIEQLPSLKELWILEWLVETLGSEFNSNGSSMTEAFKHLEALYFVHMPNWKEWLLTDGAVFPCLKQLWFDACPKLDLRLPDCFPALTKLAVHSCRQLMPCRGFSSLEELQIFSCPEQQYFSNEELGLPSSVKIRLHPNLKFEA